MFLFNAPFKTFGTGEGGVPANAITDPDGGEAITDPDGGAYITEA